MADDEIMLELAVDTADEALVREIEQAVAEANPRRWGNTRDIGTIITLISSSAGLINALIALKAALAKKAGKPDAPQVTIVIRNENRDEVQLTDLTEQSAQALISGSGH